MKKKFLILASVISIAVFTGYISFSYFQNDDIPKISKLSKVAENFDQQKNINIPTEKKLPKTKQPVTYIPKTASEESNNEIEIDPEPSEDMETVEYIKEQIYDIAVEYTDDLPLLDDIIQASADEPVALWEGDWVSTDDWKRNNDSFSIEKNDDGSFELIPEKDSSHSYSYNEETKEFVWELDYYGKIITHKARFISDDVMVLMKISGIKVALDIYKRDAG